MKAKTALAALVISLCLATTVLADRSVIIISNPNMGGWEKIGPSSGKAVNSVVVDPKLFSILYAAYESRFATGNFVVRFTNSGANWKTMPTPLQGVHFLAISAAHTTIYAASATGELYRTKDQGKSWKWMGANATILYALCADSVDDDVVYISPNWGIDQGSGGAGWRKITGRRYRPEDIYPLLVPNPNDPGLFTGGIAAHPIPQVDWSSFWPLEGIRCIAFDKQNTLTMYVGTTSRGLARTIDGAKIWELINGNQPPWTFDPSRSIRWIRKSSTSEREWGFIGAPREATEDRVAHFGNWLRY